MTKQSYLGMSDLLIRISVLLMLLTVGSVWAFDPPRIIGELRGAAPDSLEFAQSFCWAGDQNSDGFDDILVVHDGFYNYPGEERRAVNAVKLYFGGRQMDNTPDMVFQFDKDVEAIDGLSYLGRLTADNSYWFVVGSIVYEERDAIANKLSFFKGGDDLDTIPDIIWTMPLDSCFLLSNAPHTLKPTDFNNDGFDDFQMSLSDIKYGNEGHGVGALMRFNGGAEFDYNPDWVLWSRYQRESFYMEFTTGDVNGDGLADMMSWNSLFLGANPMDTTAIWTYENIEGDTAEGDSTNRTLYQFKMFPDVNGDGYDDWGCYWTELGERQDADGYYLFYGSENPDMIPDLDLEGTHNLWDTLGEIFGCDVNGDGYGDVITVNPAGFIDDGEMSMFWGSRWPERTSDIDIRMAREYNETIFGFTGASGDYNGDGVSDFVGLSERLVGDLHFRILLVLGGSRDWVVSAPKEPVKPMPEKYQWSITASPNPFNSSLNITVTAPKSGKYKANIFDTNGRRVAELIDRRGRLSYEAGEHTFTWQAPTAGVYLIAVTSEQGARVVKKVVCLR